MPAHVVTSDEWLDIHHTPAETVVGIDEAGRGAWAGPVVVGILELRAADHHELALKLKDSKVLTPRRRYQLCKEIVSATRLRFDIGSVDNRAIDEVGIDEATGYAFVGAMTRMWVPPMRHLRFLFDGLPTNWHQLVHDWLKEYVDDWYFMPKADANEPAVSGASILAKVEHDADMAEEAEDDDNRWRFSQNMGYGSPAHLELLKAHGKSPIHRMSYSPMKEMFRG